MPHKTTFVTADGRRVSFMAKKKPSSPAKNPAELKRKLASIDLKMAGMHPKMKEMAKQKVIAAALF